MPRVIKNDGSRCNFIESKMRSGIMRALEKRPIAIEEIEMAINRVIHALRSSGDQEVPTSFIGGLVMAELRNLDEVAYVRFASVYRSFQDVNAFREEINRLTDGN